LILDPFVSAEVTSKANFGHHIPKENLCWYKHHKKAAIEGSSLALKNNRRMKENKVDGISL